MLTPELTFVAGKGGVGRSAITAALAQRAARTQKRVLAVALTDPNGLAAHLGVELDHRPHQIRAGLYAMAVERRAALNEYLRIQFHVPRLAPVGALARGLNLLVDAVPGIRDIITIGKVLYEARAGSWDSIIVDTPASGQFISYLRAPATVARLAPPGPIREQSGWMEALLADRIRTGVLLVSLAEELPVAETLQSIGELRAEDLAGLAGVIVNRCLEPLPGNLDRIPEGPFRQAAIHQQGLATRQAAWRQRLPSHSSVPYFFGIRTPAEVAMRIADEMGET